MKKTIVCLLAILLILAFVSCDSSVPQNIYTVKFDGNGAGSGSVPSAIEVTEGQSFTVPANGTLVKNGYDLDSWNTKADGTGQIFTPGSTPVAQSNLVLYAQWKLHTYSIKYDLRGGSLPGSVSNLTEYTIETEDFTLNNPIKEDYVFLGWKVEGSEDSTAKENVTIENGTIGELSFVAVWSANPKYTLTFDSNGAEGSGPSPISAYSGETITLPGGDAFSNVDYLFKEWNTEKNGTGTSYKENDEIKVNNHLTLYAILETNPLTFTLRTESDSYSVKRKNTTFQYVVIPSKYQGKPVTTIEQYAFENYSSLKSVTIPSSITIISNNAFKNCSSLETIIYQGTIEAWIAINKVSGWAVSIKTKEIQCTNGKTPIK